MTRASLSIFIVQHAFQTLELFGDLALARDQREHVDHQDQPGSQKAIKHEREITWVHWNRAPFKWRGRSGAWNRFRAALPPGASVSAPGQRRAGTAPTGSARRS